MQSVACLNLVNLSQVPGRVNRTCESVIFDNADDITETLTNRNSLYKTIRYSSLKTNVKNANEWQTKIIYIYVNGSRL